MTRFTTSRPALAVLTLLGLGASTLLTGCWEKDGKGDCQAPTGGTCSIAARVVDLSKTTGCGLALHLADSSYVVPTGSLWTDFHATAGQYVLVGYTKKTACQTTCKAGPLVELGCISVNPTPTTTTTTTTTVPAN